MTFLESLKTCLIDKPFTFSGRASRSEYWWFVLFYFLIGFLIDSVLETLFPYSTADWVNRLIPLAIDFVILLVLSSGTCRRLHDINRSGWWQLINGPFIILTCFVWIVSYFASLDIVLDVMLILIGLIFMAFGTPPIWFVVLLIIFFSPIMPLIWLWWMIKKGTPGPNRFGEDPLQPPQSMNTETESVADTNHPAPAGHPSVGGEK